MGCCYPELSQHWKWVKVHQGHCLSSHLAFFPRVCVLICVYVCRCMCVHMWRPEVNISYLFPSLLLFGTGSLAEPRAHPLSIDWLVPKAKGSFWLCLPISGVRGICPLPNFSHGHWRVKLRSSVLQNEHFFKPTFPSRVANQDPDKLRRAEFAQDKKLESPSL